MATGDWTHSEAEDRCGDSWLLQPFLAARRSAWTASCVGLSDSHRRARRPRVAAWWPQWYRYAYVSPIELSHMIALVIRQHAHQQCARTRACFYSRRWRNSGHGGYVTDSGSHYIWGTVVFVLVFFPECFWAQRPSPAGRDRLQPATPWLEYLRFDSGVVCEQSGPGSSSARKRPGRG